MYIMHTMYTPCRSIIYVYAIRVRTVCFCIYKYIYIYKYLCSLSRQLNYGVKKANGTYTFPGMGCKPRAL